MTAATWSWRWPCRAMTAFDVTLSRYSPDGATDPVTVQVPNPVPGAKPDAALYAAAVVASEKALEDKWKALTLGGGDQETILAINVPITSAADWGAVRDRLARIPFVRGSQVDLFARNEVHLRLRVRGDANLLKIGFSQQDLVFTARRSARDAGAAHARSVLPNPRLHAPARARTQRRLSKTRPTCLRYSNRGDRRSGRRSEERCR